MVYVFKSWAFFETIRFLYISVFYAVIMVSKEWIKKEVEIWKRENIINSSQSQAILSKYGLAKKPEKVKVQKEEEKHTKLITVISIIGAILIGLGVIVFVASNWQEIPSFFKLIILFGTTFATYFAGWKLQHNTHPKIGHSFLFLGSLFAGATIFLTAQIFHVEANVHWLSLLWFIAIFPLSYGFDSKPTLVLSLLTFGLWMAMYGEFEGAGVFLFYGLTLYGVGYLHEKTKFSKFRISYQSFGLFFTLAVFYSVIVSELNIIEEIGSHWLSYVFLITAIATIISSAFYLGRGTGKKHEFAWNLVAFVSALSVFILSLTIDNIPHDLSGNLWAFLIFFHIMFFLLVIATTFSGYYQRITSFVNIGLLFFVLYIGYFYFTTVFQYLPKSLALVIGGAILLGGGWYLEKKRRSIIEEIESK